MISSRRTGAKARSPKIFTLLSRLRLYSLTGSRRLRPNWWKMPSPNRRMLGWWFSRVCSQVLPVLRAPMTNSSFGSLMYGSGGLEQAESVSH